MSALPTKKALQAFLYTREGLVIDVVPKQFPPTIDPINGINYRIGDLVSRQTPPPASTGGSGGFFQGTESVVTEVDLHDPTYADIDALDLFGVLSGNEPPNKFLVQDVDGDLDIEDFGLETDFNTFAGSLRRVACLVDGDIHLVRLWDVVSDQAASVAVADVGKAVYVSKTDGGSGHTGKAGRGTIDDQSGVAGIVKLGTVHAIPQIGLPYAYVELNPTLYKKS
jgi:hypothetical protein